MSNFDSITRAARADEREQRRIEREAQWSESFDRSDDTDSDSDFGWDD